MASNEFTLQKHLLLAQTLKQPLTVVYIFNDRLIR